MSKSKKRRSGKSSKKGSAGRKPASKTSFWDSLEPRYRHLISLGVLVVIALGFFAPVNFQGKRLVGSDAIQSRAMAESMVEYQKETGEVGLWSPNLFSGMPGYFISYQPVVVQADVIVRALRRVAYPTFQFLLLVIGVYVLMVVLTGQSLAGLVAAAAFGLTTYIPIILEAGHNSKFVALSWVPWIALAFVYVLRRPGALTGLIFAAVLALGLRAGHAQITYDTFFLLGIWWLAEGYGAIREKKARSFAFSTAWLVVGTGLALLMVAQPYLSQLEYKQYSMRGGGAIPVEGAREVVSGGGLAFDYAMAWSQGWLELLTYLIAGALGGGDAYWGAKIFTSGPHYLGGIVLALSLIALFGKRSRTTTAIGVSVLVITLFALGENIGFFNRLFFDYFPFFNSFRAPEIWLHMVEFGLAILAGVGAAWLIRPSRDESEKRLAWMSFGGVFGLTVILLLTGPSILSFEKPNEREQLSYQAALQNNTTPDNPQVAVAVDRYLQQVKEERVKRFRRDAMRTSIFLGLALVGLFLFYSSRISGAALVGILALLTIVDLWGVGKRHLSSDAYTSGELTEQIPEYGFDRYIEERIEAVGGPGHFRTLSLERSPTDWARPAFYYEISGGYHAAKLRIYQDLINHLGLGGNSVPPNQTMLDLTGTRYIISRRPVPGAQPVYQDENTGLTVFERPQERWGLRTSLVDDVIVAEDEAGALAALRDPGFDRAETAVLLADPGELGAIDSASTAEVELDRYLAHEVEWTVRTDARRLLVTSEVYYPAGWTATIDGEETEILQTNHAFRSVVVPEGEHVIRMVFHPESHYRGVWISMLVTIFVYGTLILLVGIRVIRDRRKKTV